MASTPTTKSQVQAYRFVLRRMQSALVRRDAVMLHDPMRTHSRATAVGVVLGAVIMLGFLLVGLFLPDPKLDDETQIAISKETGQVYVVRRSPNQLIPMTNLASARLLLLQEGNPDKAQSGSVGGGDAPAQAAAAAAGGEPKLVSEKALALLPKGRLTGIPDGPDMLPASADQRIDAAWSVCDKIDLDKSLNDPTGKGTFKTTVLAGVSGGGQALDGNKALLVRAGTDAKKAYLIYKAPENSKITSTSTVRAAVDLSKSEISSALNLQKKVPRVISAGLLNAIPEVKPLTAPPIDKQGTPVTYISGENLKIGDVIEVGRTGATADFYVVLEDGLQKVSRAVGDLIRAARTQGEPKKVDIARIGDALKPSKTLDLDDYPTEVPQVLDANPNNVVVCLGWRAENPFASNMSEHTQVTISSSLPVKDDAVPVDINQVGATGEVVSQFVMAPGKVAVVRSATSTEDFDSGPIHLITGRGVKYGIPDTITSAALGLGTDKFTPAPDSIVRLLPNGPQLNRNDAARSYDSIPMPDGAGILPEEKNAGG